MRSKKYSFSVIGFLLSIFFSLFSESVPPFSDTLLIINYNFPHYESIPTLKTLYKEYFPNIIFYGEKEDPEVIQFKHHEGFLSYYCIADAMEKYPDFDGYLFLHDDCILHPWNLSHLKRNSIWFSKIRWGQSALGTACNLKAQAERGFSWWPVWRSEWGYPSAVNVFNELPEKYKSILAQNWGPDSVATAYSDIMYIPGKYKDDFITLAQLFLKYGAHLEWALPTIASCLQLKTDWEYLAGFGFRRANRPKNINDYCFYHPLKLSYEQNREYILGYFKTMGVNSNRLGNK